jgi:hypothetical protein
VVLLECETVLWGLTTLVENLTGCNSLQCEQRRIYLLYHPLRANFYGTLPSRLLTPDQLFYFLRNSQSNPLRLIECQIKFLTFPDTHIFGSASI